MRTHFGYRSLGCAGGKPIVKQNVWAKYWAKYWANYDAGPGRPTLLLDAHPDIAPVVGHSKALQETAGDCRVQKKKILWSSC